MEGIDEELEGISRGGSALDAAISWNKRKGENHIAFIILACKTRDETAFRGDEPVQVMKQTIGRRFIESRPAAFCRKCMRKYLAQSSFNQQLTITCRIRYLSANTG